MLDLGFSEMMVIAAVALIVLGPERLPKVARTVGHLFGRMQRYVNDVKADITREMELDELRKFRQTVEETATSMQSGFSAFESDARATGDELAAMTRSSAPAPVTGLADAGDASMSLPAPGHDMLPAAPLEATVAAGETSRSSPWVEPSVASAMNTDACSATYVSSTTLAMSGRAEGATGVRRAGSAVSHVEPAPGAWTATREA
ncbi:MAG: twin-arginine translocase subunit TatB [Proteobacteria bacterium]|nr:twin-arginine translocase subunit TatB [Burkholderiales bacterium]